MHYLRNLCCYRCCGKIVKVYGEHFFGKSGFFIKDNNCRYGCFLQADDCVIFLLSAHKDELGFEPPLVKVQVKSSEGSIGNPQVAELYGNVSAQEFGLFVTLGNFTAQAFSFAKGKPNLRLIDGDELVRLVLSHYDRFDSAYKSLLPLRRVYIPDAVGDEEE